MKQTSNTAERQHVFATLNKESKICDFSTSHKNFNDYIRDKVENTDPSRPIPMNFLVHFDFPKEWYMEMRNLMPFQTLKNNIHFIGAREGYFRKSSCRFGKRFFVTAINWNIIKRSIPVKIKNIKTFSQTK